MRHLLCRWHVYEAIKRHCACYFKCYERGIRQAKLNDFITAFKNVVCAPSEVQMRTLWDSAMAGSEFPEAAVQWVKKEYYNSPKARQIMECYVFDCGNLHQTTTSHKALERVQISCLLEMRLDVTRKPLELVSYI